MEGLLVDLTVSIVGVNLSFPLTGKICTLAVHFDLIHESCPKGLGQLFFIVFPAGNLSGIQW